MKPLSVNYINEIMPNYLNVAHARKAFVDVTQEALKEIAFNLSGKIIDKKNVSVEQFESRNLTSSCISVECPVIKSKQYDFLKKIIFMISWETDWFDGRVHANIKLFFKKLNDSEQMEKIVEDENIKGYDILIANGPWKEENLFSMLFFLDFDKYKINANKVINIKSIENDFAAIISYLYLCFKKLKKN